MTTRPDPHPGVHSTAAPPAAWDDYVRRQPGSSVYQLAGWAECARRLFGLEAHYLHCLDAQGAICGVLPLLRQRSLVFGDRLTSLPYFNYGGALASDEATRARLMDGARDLARQLGCRRLELRDTLEPPPGWAVRRDKVSMLLELPDDVATLQKQLGSKLRSQVRRAQREPLEVRVGGRERVDDFYAVFASVMHELGTPVYPKRFFERLAEELPEFCTLVTLGLEGRPVSGAFLVASRDTLEIPWAGTIAAVRSKSTNMALYWEVLKLAVERGFRRFDFGRSTVDSGTYQFKKQWGAVPLPLHWAVWPGEPNEAAANHEPGRARALVTSAWRRLPLAVANRMGPWVSPALPW